MQGGNSPSALEVKRYKGVCENEAFSPSKKGNLCGHVGTSKVWTYLVGTSRIGTF